MGNHGLASNPWHVAYGSMRSTRMVSASRI